MDIGVVSLIISGAVGVLQLLTYLQHKESNMAEELDYMKKDIFQLKIDNSVCASDRSHTDEDVKNTIKLLEKLDDKLDGIL
jgi:hypothetical protein